MRAVSAKIINGAYVLGSLTAMNRIGSVTESTAICTNLTLNYLSGDFIRNLTITTTSKGVARVILVTNNGTTLSRGIAATGSTSQTLLFTSDEPLLGFWGFENNNVNITAIGTVSVSRSCVVPEKSKSKSGAFKLALGLGVGVGGGITIILLVVVCCYYGLERKHRQEKL